MGIGGQAQEGSWCRLKLLLFEIMYPIVFACSCISTLSRTHTHTLTHSQFSYSHSQHYTLLKRYNISIIHRREKKGLNLILCVFVQIMHCVCIHCIWL